MLIHSIKLSVPLMEESERYDERIAWCNNMVDGQVDGWDVDLGEPYDDHTTGETMIDETYIFRERNHALLFKLTWGGR